MCSLLHETLFIARWPRLGGEGMGTMGAVFWGRGSATTAPRVAWVDAGKGLAISLVVLFHSARWLDGLPSDTVVWQTVNDVLATLRLPLFFTLSGLFAAKWLVAPLGRVAKGFGRSDSLVV